MITFLCWISNKDALFEVEVTTNAGMGKRASLLVIVNIVPLL